MSQALPQKKELTMAEVYGLLGAPSAKELSEITDSTLGAQESFVWTMDKERVFQRQMDDAYDDNKIETPFFTFNKKIGKQSERAAIVKYDFLIDNTTGNLKDTDLKCIHNGRLFEVKAQYNPCYANSMLDENYMKTHFVISLFERTQNQEHNVDIRRPGSIYRLLMVDLDGYVMFHVYEYDNLAPCQRFFAFDEREDAADQAKRKTEKSKKPLNYKYHHNKTRWLIYPVRAFAKRLLELLKKKDDDVAKRIKDYNVVAKISEFEDIRVSDSEFRRLNGRRG